MSCAAAQDLRRVAVAGSTRSVLPSSPVGGRAYFVNSKSAVWVLPSKRLRDSDRVVGLDRAGVVEAGADRLEAPRLWRPLDLKRLAPAQERPVQPKRAGVVYAGADSCEWADP